jgi:hypothetical protein
MGSNFPVKLSKGPFGTQISYLKFSRVKNFLRFFFIPMKFVCNTDFYYNLFVPMRFISNDTASIYHHATLLLALCIALP